jgi:hypothetical protein
VRVSERGDASANVTLPPSRVKRGANQTPQTTQRFFERVAVSVRFFGLIVVQNPGRFAASFMREPCNKKSRRVAHLVN